MNEWDVKQKQMSEWVEHNLGKGAMDPTERATRFLEEAIELAQAVDVPYRTVRTLTSHVYRKPRGDAAQEIGGVATTMLSLCESLHKQFAAEADREIERIHRLPPEKFRQRQALNAASGIGKPSDKP
jgi:NTP pyrophosphatase (non-canonical NTP hydrolase)